MNKFVSLLNCGLAIMYLAEWNLEFSVIHWMLAGILWPEASKRGKI